MAEVLYDCPACGRVGYTHSGLRAHVCPELGRRHLTMEEWMAALEAGRTMRKMALKSTPKKELPKLRAYLHEQMKVFPITAKSTKSAKREGKC